jgi:hypothetical protein
VTAPRRDGITGAVLYAAAALLVVTGSVWWVRAAPPPEERSQVTAWRVTAEKLLPDRYEQIAAGTVVIRAEGASEVTAETRPGRHYLFFLCAGHGQVLIRLSSGGPESGRLVDCEDPPVVQSLAVGLADRFYLQISGGAASTVVFRWLLTIASR